MVAIAPNFTRRTVPRNSKPGEFNSNLQHDRAAAIAVIFNSFLVALALDVQHNRANHHLINAVTTLGER